LLDVYATRVLRVADGGSTSPSFGSFPIKRCINMRPPHTTYYHSLITIVESMRRDTVVYCQTLDNEPASQELHETVWPRMTKAM